MSKVCQRPKDDAPSYRIGYEGARCDVAIPISARMIQLQLLRLRALRATLVSAAIVVADLGHG
jgi:hypothetical protein